MRLEYLLSRGSQDELKQKVAVGFQLSLSFQIDRMAGERSSVVRLAPRARESFDILDNKRHIREQTRIKRIRICRNTEDKTFTILITRDEKVK